MVKSLPIWCAVFRLPLTLVSAAHLEQKLPQLDPFTLLHSTVGAFGKRTVCLQWMQNKELVGCVSLLRTTCLPACRGHRAEAGLAD